MAEGLGALGVPEMLRALELLGVLSMVPSEVSRLGIPQSITASTSNASRIEVASRRVDEFGGDLEWGELLRKRRQLSAAAAAPPDGSKPDVALTGG